jgi:hypothetical protein
MEILKMTETAKTLAFMAAGAVALLAAFFVVPRENTFDVNELVGQELNQFEIDAPKRLKIIKYDGDTGAAREFEVAEENGLWQIPSKQGYPADATQQMADAATCLMDREILRIAATTANEHERLGVIDPTSAKLTTDAKSVGTRVIMSDSNNNVLTDMIVGKKVKDAEGQYFVRNTNQDVVYVVALDPKKLSTKFDDWIEDDLLKINPFDIRKVSVKDYTAEMMLTLQGFKVNWDRRAEMTLTYNNTDSKWNAESLKKFDTGTKQYVDYQVADDEELNEEALNKLRDGLDDLLIVDVERKPAGLSADLKGGADFIKDEEAATSLMSRGFAPVAVGADKQADILSTEGEIVTSLQDGVEYVLRFGNLQMEDDDGEHAAEAGDEESEVDAAKAAKKSDDSINRYLFVMARFNEDMIEKPKLEELPELPPDAKEDEGETASETGAAAENAESEAGEVAPADDEEKSEAEGAESKETESAEKPADAEQDAKDKELADIIAARKEIEQENQRRLDEYQDKIKKGKETVAKLNERFGDWYYVISNDVYQQVHLGLDKVVKKKGAKEGENATGPGAAAGALGLPNLPFSAPPASTPPAAEVPAATSPAEETPATEVPATETTTSEAPAAAETPATETPAAEE